MPTAEQDRPAGGRGRARTTARRIAAVVLIALGVLAATAANPASWARETLLDTDAFTATVGQVADEPAVTEAVTEAVVEEAFSAAEVRRRTERAIAERVGEEGSPLIAVALTEALERGTRRAVREVVEGRRFAALWEAAVARAHGATIGVLRGEEVAGVSTAEGRVVLDLGPVAAGALGRLESAGLGGLLPEDSVVQRQARVTVVNSGTIDDLGTGVDAIDTLGLVLPFAAVALLAGGVALSVAWRRALIAAMVALGLAMLATLVALRIVREGVLGTIDDPVVLDAARSVWDVALGQLIAQTIGILVAAAVVAAVAWITGPAPAARRLRVWAWRVAGRGGVPPAEPASHTPASFVAANRNTLRAVGLLAGLVCLLLIPGPALAPLLIVAGAVLLYLGALELIAPSWGGGASDSA